MMIEEDSAFPEFHPILTDGCVGHEDAESLVLDSINSNRLHHAWLITGAKGIGKATFAYRVAKYLLANDTAKNQEDGLFGDTLESTHPVSLDIATDSPILGRIKAGGHGDLLTLERSMDEKRKVMRNFIVVDDVREAHAMFHATSSEGGWRIIVVDSADEMNRNAANALLKILEEPPQKALLLLVAHAPGKLLPTIRSRCRTIQLKPLSNEKVHQVLKEKFPNLDPNESQALAELADGSPGKAIHLKAQDGLALYADILNIMANLKQMDVPALHAMAAGLTSAKAFDKYTVFLDLLSNFFERMIRYTATGEHEKHVSEKEIAIFNTLQSYCGVDRWLEVWEKMGKDRARADGINMDKKLMIVSLFSNIAALAK